MHVQGNNVVENRDNECLVLVDVPKSTGYAILLKAFVCQNTISLIVSFLMFVEFPR